MNTKIKSLLLAAFLLMAIGLKAQETGGYEFAIVEGGLSYSKVAVTKNDNTELIDVPNKSKNTSTTIKTVEDMVKDGWMVFNTTTLGVSAGVASAHVFYLRRKIK